MEQKFDFNDISLIPATISYVSSRSDINIYNNEKLPLFVAPMDTVIDENNYKTFLELGLNVCIPRGCKGTFSNDCFISYGLEEIENIVYGTDNRKLPYNVLIDVANGHSIRAIVVAKRIVTDHPHVNLMVGNIANPETYKEYCKIGVWGVRCGIGGGSACTTSANVSIHYPMASLISECYNIKKNGDYPTKIIADGGFKGFDDIIKALGLGADYVMLGSIINKSIESSGFDYIFQDDEYIKVTREEALEVFNNGYEIYKKYRGMSTKSVQKKWGKTELKTAEGITKYNKVEYSISKWLENFSDYLKSCMSYQGKFDLNQFIGNSKYIFITEQAYLRYKK